MAGMRHLYSEGCCAVISQPHNKFYYVYWCNSVRHSQRCSIDYSTSGGAAIFSNFVGVLSEIFLGLNLFTLDPVMGQNICDIAQQDRPRQFQVAKTYNCRSPAGQRNACSRSYGQHLPPNARRQCDQRPMPATDIGVHGKQGKHVSWAK